MATFQACKLGTVVVLLLGIYISDKTNVNLSFEIKKENKEIKAFKKMLIKGMIQYANESKKNMIEDEICHINSMLKDVISKDNILRIVLMIANRLQNKIRLKNVQMRK